MKKSRYFFIVPMLLLGSMNVLAQKEAVHQSEKTIFTSTETLEEARAAYFSSKESLSKAVTSSRAALSAAQSDYDAKKKAYRISLETAISKENDTEAKKSLEEELNALNN